MFVKIAKLDATSWQNLQWWCDLSIKLCLKTTPTETYIRPSRHMIGWIHQTPPINDVDWLEPKHSSCLPPHGGLNLSHTHSSIIYLFTY